MDTEEGRICADDPAGGNHGPLVAALYQEHVDGLRCLLIGLLRDRAEAEEALQQVFLKLLEACSTVQTTTAKGWLYTTAYHEALARRRRQKLDESALDRLRARPAWQQGNATSDPAAALARADSQAKVREALRELPESQREVVERRMYRDQTFATIAQEIGCPLSTVLSRMRLALEKLKPLLEHLR